MAQLQANDLTLAYDKVTIVDELSLDIPTGEVTIVVGANGCGKSTLLRALSRLLKPAGGKVLLDGQDIHTKPAKEVAKTLGLLPQSPTAPDGITARELISRGRYPHQGLFKRFSAEDEAAVNRALELTGTMELADRAVDELSGGQRQRVWIAMALAQETELLLLDEPTTFLDVAHQLEVLDVISELNRTRGITVVIVLHDLNLAARYADHLVALREGKIYAAGHPNEVVTERTVKDVFGMPSRVIPDPVAGTPLVLPIGRHRVLRTENVLAAQGIVRSPEFVELTKSAVKQEPTVADELQTPVLAPQEVEPAQLRPGAEHLATLAYQCMVMRTQDLTPAFRRITVGGTDLSHFGTNSHSLDMRIKLLLPPAGGSALTEEIAALRPEALSSPAGQEGWYRRWLSIDPSSRGYMRTYTVRAFREVGHRDNLGDTAELDIDFVMHGQVVNGALQGGPATEFADRAQVGDELLLLGPNRALSDETYGGIEFRPGGARRVVLAGDETAAPAICAILEALPANVTGHALIEVPDTDDILGASTRSGVSVQWLTRGTNEHGVLLAAAVKDVVAIPAAGAVHTDADPEDIDIDEQILWETGAAESAPFYAWIAGEAGMVKELRRYLVREAGINRKQVAFMGYWRRGKTEN
ncbi:SIP domain-containing protein [Glutamicibacter bergerei]|jgi:iron complex transport system ATP-binding protein|uniref:Mycobactin import ATP-binding/permease protein IrtA n=2 Tax=Glutamicibacter TaxID=1742989 RepID=A0ABV9MMC1_9MICC|nr:MULTISPECIES: SIP domain-containing protein [Glutamicibacter]PCC35206.1 cobalamin ABC transporter ATP-binding protein [Glutamicibacter sp. BW77]GGJ46259.1 cobalamin ABC transporter ATP-binding protein [Glutamicibacter ardleyensis]HBV10917.1 cobalamin ABC transporter ATP-binding protein [Micrococcaceae bacterium]